MVVPEGTDESLMRCLLTLSDADLTDYHAARQEQVGPGRTVTVIGDGAVGLSAVLAEAYRLTDSREALRVLIRV